MSEQPTTVIDKPTEQAHLAPSQEIRNEAVSRDIALAYRLAKLSPKALYIDPTEHARIREITAPRER